MSRDNFEQFIYKKAYEISYALFRVAASLKRTSFSDKFEDLALTLLASAVSEDYVKSSAAARAVEYLLKFGEDVGLINQTNRELIVSELRVFNSAIAELEKEIKHPSAINLENIFSKSTILAKTREAARGINYEEINSFNTAINNSNGQSPENMSFNGGNGNGNHNPVKAAMRQTAILERIRQNGNCRLKDVQECIPEASERTIRYDLQNLIEQGLVERVGNGGPATFYRTRL